MTRHASTFSIWLAVAGVPILAALLYPLQAKIDAETVALRREQDALLFRSGLLLKKLSLGYEPLLADIYWTRAVQYYGGKRQAHDPHFDLLWPLLDVTTALDPHLLVAYRFGSVFLAEPPPRGTGRPDLAVDLIRRGIAANPDYWRFWQDLGFIYYWDMKNYAQASAAFLQGSKQPHADPWMAVMAAKIAEEGESPQTSYFLWAQAYNSTRDPSIRQNALEHMRALRAEQDLEQLEGLAQDYRRRFGHFPASIRELVDAGMLPGVPVDPLDHPYRLGRDGKAALDPASPISLDILKPVLPPPE